MPSTVAHLGPKVCGTAALGCDSPAGGGRNRPGGGPITAEGGCATFFCAGRAARLVRFALLTSIISGFAAVGNSGCQPNTVRDTRVESRAPHQWATPLDRPGLGNFCRVSDHLYRGEQPTSEGFDQLHAMGVKTVVDLRAFHSDRAETDKAGLDYVHFSMLPFVRPDDGDVAEFLRVVTDPNRQPVFVHCQVGADRTGVMCAVYRVVVEGWSKQAAIDEMKNGGFRWTGFDVLERYVQDLDVPAIRRRVGGPATQPEPAEVTSPAL